MVPSCEKCWEDAYLRWMEHPEKDRTDHYKDLLRERTSNPCSPEEQAGQFWDEKNRCDFRLVKMKEVFNRDLKETLKVMAEAAAKLKVDREAKEAKDKAEDEAAERARQAELAPDKEKIVSFASSLSALKGPEVKDKKSQKIIKEAIAIIYGVANTLFERARTL